MNGLDTALSIGESPVVGPARIEIFQPSPAQEKDASSLLLAELRRTNRLLESILSELQKPTLWQKFIRRLKHVALFR